MQMPTQGGQFYHIFYSFIYVKLEFDFLSKVQNQSVLVACLQCSPCTYQLGGYTGCSPKNGTQVNGYKTVAIQSNRLKLGDHNVKGFYDTPT